MVLWSAVGNEQSAGVALSAAGAGAFGQCLSHQEKSP